MRTTPAPDWPQPATAWKRVLEAVDAAREIAESGTPNALADAVEYVRDFYNGGEVLRPSEPTSVTPDAAPVPFATIRADAEAFADQERVPLGLDAVDAAVGGGVLSGWVVTIGAFTGAGKTTLSCATAGSFAGRGHPTLFVTLENSRYEIAAKIAGIDPSATYPTLDIFDASRRLDVVEHVVSSWAEAHDGAEYAPALVLDYLQKLTTPENHSREREVAVACEAIQHLARRLGVIVIAAAQLSREGHRNGPDLTHFRESGLIEQVSDIALIGEKVGDDRLKVTVAKNRWGASGQEIDLAVDWARCALRTPGPGEIWTGLATTIIAFMSRRNVKDISVLELTRNMSYAGQHPKKYEINAAVAASAGRLVVVNNVVFIKSPSGSFSNTSSEPSVATSLGVASVASYPPTPPPRERRDPSLRVAADAAREATGGEPDVFGDIDTTERSDPFEAAAW